MRRGLIMIAVMLLTACHVDTTVDIAMGSDGVRQDHGHGDRRRRGSGQAPGLADDLRFDDAKSRRLDAHRADRHL